MLSSLESSAVSLDFVLTQSGKICFVSYSGLSQGEAHSRVAQMDFLILKSSCQLSSYDDSCTFLSSLFPHLIPVEISLNKS